MMKSYVYQPSHFSIQMTAPGIFTAAIGVFCLYQFWPQDIICCIYWFLDCVSIMSLMYLCHSAIRLKSALTAGRP